MFTLIALGIAAAYGDSVVALLAESSAAHSHQSVHLYFEAAAAITVLVLLGQVLELRARRQTSRRDPRTLVARAHRRPAESSMAWIKKSRSRTFGTAICCECGRG